MSKLATNESPWMGLYSYSEDDAAYFYGRDNEITEILERVLSSQLTVVYGPSGLGKTSLLGAGVCPMLKNNGIDAKLPRFSYLVKAKSILAQTREKLGELYDCKIPEEVTLWEFFHHKENSHIAKLNCVLIFDQFEEIFTIFTQHRNSQERDEWLIEISDLIQNRPPDSLVKKSRKQPDILNQFDYSAMAPRFVIALREEYLFHLEKWHGKLPLIKENRMAVGYLSGEQARSAVIIPGQQGNAAIVSKDVGDFIIRTSAGLGEHADFANTDINPSMLSLLCHQLNKKRLEHGLDHISSSMVHSESDGIREAFYKECFENFEKAEDVSAVQTLIETHLLTPGEHRTPFPKDEAVKWLKKENVESPAKAVEDLINMRLISEIKSDVIRLEITHDTMVPVIVASRDKKLKYAEEVEAQKKDKEKRSRAKAAREKIYSVKEKFLQESLLKEKDIIIRKAKYNLRISFVILGVAIIIGIFLTFFFAKKMEDFAMERQKNKELKKQNLEFTKRQAVYEMQMSSKDEAILKAKEETASTIENFVKAIKSAGDFSEKNKILLQLEVEKDSIQEDIKSTLQSSDLMKTKQISVEPQPLPSNQTP